MERMKIFVAGSGKLAHAILTADLTVKGCEMVKWDAPSQQHPEKAMVVHAGSGRQLKECVEFCERTKSVLIELATGMETETMDPHFPLVICPNTSVLVLKTLQMLKTSGHHFKDYELSVTESHQATKTTAPGTALAFAHSIHCPSHQVISIRDPRVQRNTLGIPEEYLDKHAWHQIVVKDGLDEVTLQTRVLGHESYAKGVKQIIQAMLKNKLENKRYTILELIDANML